MFKGKSKKKNRLFKSLAALAILGGMHTMASGECPDEILMNASFEYADDVGRPVAWKVPDESKSNMGSSIENGILKLWVKEGGNAAVGGDGAVVMNQKFTNSSALLGRKLYCRAWVKNTSFDKATPDDLACIGEQNVDAPQPNGNKCHTGAQIAIQHAYSLPGPPFFGWKEWNAWYDSDGTAMNEWTKVEGEVDARTDVTHLWFIILLRSQNSCTLWVDNIQISTEPDFCGQDFTSPDGVRNKNAVSIAKQSSFLSIKGNRVTFQKPTSYTLQVVAPNGKRFVKTSGYGDAATINTKNLAPGFYIVNVSSHLGKVTKSFIVPGLE